MRSMEDDRNIEMALSRWALERKEPFSSGFMVKWHRLLLWPLTGSPSPTQWELDVHVLNLYVGHLDDESVVFHLCWLRVNPALPTYVSFGVDLELKLKGFEEFQVVYYWSLNKICLILHAFICFLTFCSMGCAHDERLGRRGKWLWSKSQLIS